MMNVMLLLAAMTPDAHAGDLEIGKRGLLFAHAWVDGEPVGRLTRRGVTRALSDPGPHEVWVSIDPDGLLTRCHGTVPTSGGDVMIRDRGCEGFNSETEPDTFWRGAWADLGIGLPSGAIVTIDGHAPISLMAARYPLNVAPGTHTLSVSIDPAGVQVFSEGTFEVEPGGRAGIHCTTAGCEGLQGPSATVSGSAPPVAATPAPAPSPSSGVPASNAAHLDAERARLPPGVSCSHPVNGVWVNWNYQASTGQWFRRQVALEQREDHSQVFATALVEFWDGSASDPTVPSCRTAGQRQGLVQRMSGRAIDDELWVEGTSFLYRHICTGDARPEGVRWDMEGYLGQRVAGSDEYLVTLERYSGSTETTPTVFRRIQCEPSLQGEDPGTFPR